MGAVAPTRVLGLIECRWGSGLVWYEPAQPPSPSPSLSPSLSLQPPLPPPPLSLLPLLSLQRLLLFFPSFLSLTGLLNYSIDNPFDCGIVVGLCVLFVRVREERKKNKEERKAFVCGVRDNNHFD